MRRTIIRSTNTRRFRIMTDPKDTMLIVLCGGEDGRGMFVAKGRFKLSGRELGEGFMVCGGGDGGYGYDVVG